MPAPWHLRGCLGFVLKCVLMGRPFTTAEQEALRLQLRSLLESEYFRNSQRCSRFLEYSVQFLLQRQPGEDLKERRIGIDVFRRQPDYDTSHDNVVRVTANEVRKRLAQFYATTQDTAPLVLELPPGTYTVSVRAGKAPGATEQNSIPAAHREANSSRVRRPLWIAVTVVAFTVCSIGGLSYLWREQQSATARFWWPITHGSSPVLISVSEPIAYEPANGSILNAKPGEPMVQLRDSLVGVGDTFALADISRYLTASRVNWRMVAGNELPSQELRTGPVILIGVHSNLWTTRLMSGLRYTFGTNNTVLDRGQVVAAWSLPALSPDWQTPEDYAIVSRFRSNQTGEPVLILAGLTNSGTQAAGEFATNRELLTEALRNAPKGWEDGNVQFVLHTQLMGRTPARPIVIASYFWR
jgi:hypothetical protein